MTGKLIVIDGVDSCGKKTQTDLLVEKLNSSGHDVVTADFPQYYSSFHGKIIARYLRGEFGDIDSISPYLASLTYAGDRREGKKDLWKALEENKIVIANRYSTSNIAFMGARFSDITKQDEFIAWIEELEYEVNGIPRPDLVIFLDVPVDVAQKWIKTKKKRKYLQGKRKDIHEKNVSYLLSVDKVYQRLSKERDNWKRIDCMSGDVPMPVDKIADKVRRLVLENLE